ncbi:MAG: hypothetical protein JWR07_1884 [Nevskia sp.]|nr:hypothetical protein [Nevskia sp.]
MIELPPLPDADHSYNSGIFAPLWGEKRMREYALLAVAAQVEKDAKLCEEKAESIARVNTYRGKVHAVSQHAADMVGSCAAAIRAQGK